MYIREILKALHLYCQKLLGHSINNIFEVYLISKEYLPSYLMNMQTITF